MSHASLLYDLSVFIGKKNEAKMREEEEEEMKSFETGEKEKNAKRPEMIAMSEKSVFSSACFNTTEQ